MNLRHPSGLSYNPARDILNLYTPVARNAMARLAKANWHSAIKDHAVRNGVTEADLARGAEALARFINLVASSDSTDLSVPWANSGLLTLPLPVLTIIMAQLGMGFTASFYKAAQSSVRLGQNAPGANQAGAEIDELAAAMRQPSARACDRRVAEADKGRDPDPEL